MSNIADSAKVTPGSQAAIRLPWVEQYEEVLWSKSHDNLSPECALHNSSLMGLNHKIKVAMENLKRPEPDCLIQTEWATPQIFFSFFTHALIYVRYVTGKFG